MTRIKLDIISKLRLKDDGVKILSALFIIFTIILCIKILDLYTCCLWQPLFKKIIRPGKKVQIIQNLYRC